MKNIYYILLIFVILATSCESNQNPIIAVRTPDIEKIKDQTKTDLELAEKTKDISNNKITKTKIVKPSCEIYKKADFSKEFECLYFEKDFSYDEYVKQANSVNDCDKFYSDLQNKNNLICEKYKCSEEELEEHCIDLFSYEEDIINKKYKCVEQKCSYNKFRSQCNDYEELCIEAVILGCLTKSGLALTDFNIASCVNNNKALIQRGCTIETCIKEEVKTCTDSKCKLKPTKEYIKQCKKQEKDVCTTQNRVVFYKE